VDSDDKIHPEAVEKCVGFMLEHELDIAIFDCDCFGDSQKCKLNENAYHRSQHYSIENGKKLIAQLLDNGDFYMSACMYMLNRQFLKQTEILFVPNVLHEDHPFTFLVLFMATKVGHIRENLYQRRYREGSLTANHISIKNVEGILAGMQDISRYVGRLSEVCERSITRRFLFWNLGIVIGHLRRLNAGTIEYERVKEFCEGIENIDCRDLVADRVIWYGYGYRCKNLLESLQPYQPAEIWDMRGLVPATKPVFETLSEGDALSVCVDDYSVFEEIERKCQQAGFSRVLYWKEYYLQQYIKSVTSPPKITARSSEV
jgi:TusA-related sulfurtransferase